MSDRPLLSDDDFDDMHHALGRPKNAKGETYRNYYCLAVGSDAAKRFEALGTWDLSGVVNDGRHALYRVNDKGKEALAHWLAHKRKTDASGDRDNG